MIQNIKVSWNGDDSSEKNQYALNYLKDLQEKSDKKLRVIDVGGAAQVRLPQYTTHILDFQPEKLHDDNIIKFAGDMELNSTWKIIQDDIKQNGKFDFAVCTHTLEDLNGPHQVILNLFEIANAGFIAVPTKFMDTRKWEPYYGGNYMGYHHHRWIFSIQHNIFMGYPKMGLMENKDFNFESSKVYYEQYKDKQTEISFLWETDFVMEFIPPYQYLDNFTHPEKKSRLNDLVETDDIDRLILK